MSQKMSGKNLEEGLTYKSRRNSCQEQEKVINLTGKHNKKPRMGRVSMKENFVSKSLFISKSSYPGSRNAAR